MFKQPKVSIVCPIHDMKNGSKFLWRLVNSLTEQTFKDWELIITKEGRMAENTNAGIRRARGEYIKVLYLDDYFSHSGALEGMLDVALKLNKNWIICGTEDNPTPYSTNNIETGNNHLGSPSALMFKNYFEDNLLFDETMSWLLDCDLYKRMEKKFGSACILPGNYITIGKGSHQMTHILTDEEKLLEHEYMNKKYEYK